MRQHVVRIIKAYLVLVLFILILIPLILVLVLIILILELILIQVVKALLELQRLTGEPVDGTRDELLLDVLTQLVVQLKLSLDVVVDLLVVVIAWWLGWVEEVEEGWSGNGLLDYARLLGVW